MSLFHELLYNASGQGSVFGFPEKKLIEFLGKHSFPTKSACDLGCGDGRQALFLALNGWKVLAVDNCENGLNKLESEKVRLNLDQNINISCLDLGVLKLPKKNFDLILCINTFHEIGEKATKHILNELKPALSPGGVVYLSFFGPHKGTYLKDGCYYPPKGEVIEEFHGWEILEESSILFEHRHMIPEQQLKTCTHKHMQVHLIFRRPSTS